jgi:hypothetical protein
VLFRSAKTLYANVRHRDALKMSDDTKILSSAKL